MAPKFITSWLPQSKKAARRLHRTRATLGIEWLEDRTLLNGTPQAFVVNDPVDVAQLDVGTNNPTDTNNLISLRSAIAAADMDAASGISDSISFDSSLGSSTLKLTLGVLELSGNGATITIDGSAPSTPITLDGSQNGDRLFQIDSGAQVVIQDLIVQNSTATSGDGGAILNNGTLTVNNATLSNNTASAAGGAIANTGTLTVSNTVLLGNQAVRSNSLGGAIDNTGTATVVDSTFGEGLGSQNGANFAANGGAIANAGALTVSNSTFSGDSANVGGAIDSTAGSVAISGSTFSSDSGTSGEAIENAATLMLSGSTLLGNTATYNGIAIDNSGTLTVTSTTFRGNAISGDGGGIRNNGGTVMVTNSTFSGNDGLGTGTALDNTSGTMTLTDTTISGNSSTFATAGAIIANGGTLTLQSVTVSANRDSAAIANTGGSLTVQNSIIAGNTNSGTSGDISGSITTDLGNNLLGTALNNSTTNPSPGPGDLFSNTPGLGALGNYGGVTQTMDVLAGSLAIGAGNDAAAGLPSTDQRGLPRTVSGSLDIGAFQTQPAAVVFTSLGETTEAGQATGTITVQLQDLDGNPAPAGDGGVSITLSSSSVGGSFTYPNGAAINGGQIVIPQGSSSATFDYIDTQPGTPTLTASATSFATATQQETILPGPISVTPSTDIVVGRTLSAYFTSEVQNNQETITFTVYNQQATSITGVLLTDTLEPGVTLVSASQQPDQSGQNLAWSLGTIEGDYWTSVSITVSLASSSILQLDSGAQAYATLNAGPISNATPPAVLTQGSVDPNLLASTPDANTTDPYIQQEAAILDYDPQNIFNFLETDIGYNAYPGSLRGARGTLWSDAGNALDVANLGVALMRASGIPAQYVSGTLSSEQAQTLLMSMFPASYQTVGYIPAGTTVSTVASIDQTVGADGLTLQQETESHYWFEFNTGSGWVNADPLMAAITPGGAVGQTFTTTTGSFSEVLQSLRQTTEVSLTAEIYSAADAAFGLNPFTDTVVLDQTFNDVDLVGRPLTVGNFVTQSGLGSVFSDVTNTYTPYLVIGDDALNNDQLPDAIVGQQYQEVLTSFPLSSQILTGLFLNITLSGAGGTSQMFSETLVDRIGYAARQGMAPPEDLSVSPSDPPVITPYNLTTLNILPGLQSPSAAQLAEERATQELISISYETDALTEAQVDALTAFARAELVGYAVGSDREAANLATGLSVAAYFDVPRITVFSSLVVGTNNQEMISYSIDLVNDSVKAVASPGQDAQAILGFASARGLFDSFLEAQSVPVARGGQNWSSAAIIQQSMQQGTPLAMITASNISLLQSFNLPPDAISRITNNVQQGLIVIVPTSALMVNGIPMIAWYNLNPTTGEMISESQNGAYQGIVEFQFGRGEFSILSSLLPGGGLIGISYSVFTPVLVGIKGSVAALEIALAADSYLKGRSGAFSVYFTFGVIWAILAAFQDPPAPPFLATEAIPFPEIPDDESSDSSIVLANETLGQASGQVRVTSVAIAGNLKLFWASGSASGFLVSSLQSTDATVVNALGTVVGGGIVAFASKLPADISISGINQYAVDGTGSLSVYRPADISLGISANWESYSAIVTGDDSINLTVPDGSLMLNGQTLPAGTYTITTSSATLTGSSTTSSPNFAGSATITTTGGTVNLGNGSGSLTLGDNSVDPTNGATLDGYSGSITVAAGGGGNTPDDVTLNGTTANVLTVSATADMLTTNQNTSVTFQANVNTSLADSYTITAQAPAGWTVTIDSSGKVTVTPAPGLQGGTYPIQVVAQSSTDPNLVAQTTVEVAITPTQPGMTLAVNPDPIFTVPYNGAQVPSAFRAAIQNTGPAPDTYDITFANAPSGFSIVSSATSDNVPAGQTGIVGIYLMPIAGSVLPAPGTQLSFQVTATSTTNPAITQTVTVTFTVPVIDAVTIVSNPVEVSALPGQPTTATVTLQNVGNVAASAALNFTTDTGLTLTGLSATPITLAIGQTDTETVQFTPGANVPLNSMLQATVDVGPAATQDDVSVLSVSPNSEYPTEGQTVDVSADIFASVLDPRQAEVSYTVVDSQGNTVFTSTPVPIDLGALPADTTLDLGTFSTAGLAAGQYTIDVAVDETSGQPIAGATGSGTVVVNSPLDASLTLSADTLNPDDSNSITNTLTLASQPLLGSVQTDGTAATVALNGTLAYVVGTTDINIVDVSNPASPQIVGTFGASDLLGGGIAQVSANELIVATSNSSNASSFHLLIYSLANPLAPQLLSTTTIPYQFPAGLVVQGNSVYIPTSGYTDDSNGDIDSQFGDVLAINISNPAAPKLVASLFNTLGTPEGGNTSQHGVVAINSQVAYVVGSTSTGPNTQTGSGQILIVNTTNPTTLSVTGTLDIPGTVDAQAIAVDGNYALVVGSTGGLTNPFSDPSQIGLTGNVTLTLLDISNPLDPTIVGSTVVTQNTFPDVAESPSGQVQIVDLGNGQFVISNTYLDGQPVILGVDASDPTNLLTSTLTVPATANGLTASGGNVYVTSSSGLQVYLASALFNLAVNAQVVVPSGTTVTANSFSTPPTQIVTGANSETLIWNVTITPGSSEQITWQSSVNTLQSGNVQQIVSGATFQYTVQGASEQITLPTLAVGEVPVTQSVTIPVDVVAPGVQAIEAASVAAQQLGNTGLVDRLSDLSTALTNLVQTPTSAVYQGQALADLQSLITQITNDPFLSGFTSGLTAAQTALASATTAAEVDAAVTNLGTALSTFASVITDDAAHRLTLSLSPDRAIVQSGAPEVFDIVLADTGSAATTYDLSVSGLPAGVTFAFSQPSVSLQTGGSVGIGQNPVTLTLTETGSTLVPVDFTVTATAEGATEIAQNTPGQLILPRESIVVASVVPTPSFTDPGGQVDVSATIQSVVNEPTTTTASFVVTDMNGNVLYTSPAIPVSLTVTSDVTMVDLGNLDTTGFADGTDTITVTVASPVAIPGATTLLIGQPVTGSVTTTPAVVPTGSPTVTTTVTATSQTSFPVPLTLEGGVSTPAPGTSVALYQSGGTTYAYESGTGGIDIIDVTDPTNPILLGTFGQNDITNGAYGFNVAKVIDGELFVATSNENNGGASNLLVYSLANPTTPTLVSNTSVDYRFVADLLVNSTGTAAYVPTNGDQYYKVGGEIFNFFGDVVSLDLSNPSQPVVAGALESPGSPPNGGNMPEYGGVLVNDQIGYFAGLSPGGDYITDNVGTISVVNVSNPANLTTVTTLTIPGTINTLDVAVYGNEALVVGTAGTQIANAEEPPGIANNLTLTLLDITNPSAPVILGTTLVTPEQLPYGEAGQKTDVVSLGNGDFAVSDTDANGNPALLIVDPSNPNNIAVGAVQVPSGVHGITVSGSTLYATTSSGLSIYQIQPFVDEPATITVNLPAGTAANIVSGSFSSPPAQINTSPAGDSLVWLRTFAAGNTSYSFSWQTTLSGVTAGDAVPVTTGATVAYTYASSSGTLTLPGTSVTGVPIINIVQSSLTEQPGGTATFDVQLTNPTAASVTYELISRSFGSLFTTNLSSLASVTVPAGQTVDVPLTVTANATDPDGTTPITLIAQHALPTSGFVDYQGTASTAIVVAGAPVPVPVPDAYGLVMSLTPTQAIAGIGTNATYTLQLTNVGSTDQTFSLSAPSLHMAGVSATFSTDSIDVPPGSSNFRDVTLTLTPSTTTPGTVPFTIQATDSTGRSYTVQGSLTIEPTGVSVSFDTPTANPGDTLTATVYNTGNITDTFDLSTSGPAGLVATLSTTKVTLAPGAYQTISIATDDANFAAEGSLPLTLTATSETDPSVTAGDTATLDIAPSVGLTASVSPSVQVLSVPGTADFLLTVNNTGNTQDSYSATITGTTGPITASLTGLDGLPTQSIPTFILPGLSTGAIMIDTDLTAGGQGTVTVEIQSLDDPTRMAEVTATVNAPLPVSTTTTVTTSDPNGSVYGQAVTLTATVAASGATPTGSVQFEVDGSDVGAPVTLVGGTASLSISSLNAGMHNVVAFCTSDNSLLGNSDSSDSPLPITVTPATLTITPNAGQSTIYGSALTTLTYAASGFVNNDTNSLLTGSLQTLATASSPVGTYGFTLGSLSAGNNYTLQLAANPPTIAVTPATLTITPTIGQLNVYGSILPVLMDTASGFVNNDTDAILTGALGTLATASSPVNTYAFTLGTLSAGTNYTLELATHTPTFAVTPATLTITPTAGQSTVSGSAIPKLAYSVSGLVNDDPTSTVTGLLGTTATPSSPVGTYPFTLGSFTAGTNYSLQLAADSPTFAITAAKTVPPTPPAPPAPPTPPVPPTTPILQLTTSESTASLGQPVTFTATIEPLAGAGTPTGSVTFLDGTTPLGTETLLSGVATLTTSALGAGTHTITATYGGNTSYPPTTASPLSQTISGAREGQGQIYAVGAGPGGGPRVQVYDATTNTKLLDFFAYGSTERGGVSVATGDVTGDGTEDVITGAGVGGGAQVEVFNGQTGALIASFDAYDPSFRGGVWVAAEDLYGTGVSEIVTGPGAGGGPVVEVWSLASGTSTLVKSFLAFDSSFRGGVTVATGLSAGGMPVITVGAGPGGGPEVRTFEAANLSLLSDVYAFAPSFMGGVYVASGDVLGTGNSTQILVGPGAGGGPQLVVLGTDGTVEASTFAAVGTLRNGLTVAAVDQTTGAASVLIGAGQGAFQGALNGGTLGGLNQVGFFDGFNGGVFVG